MGSRSDGRNLTVHPWVDGVLGGVSARNTLKSEALFKVWEPAGDSSPVRALNDLPGGDGRLEPVVWDRDVSGSGLLPTTTESRCTVWDSVATHG